MLMFGHNFVLFKVDERLGNPAFKKKNVAIDRHDYCFTSHILVKV